MSDFDLIKYTSLLMSVVFIILSLISTAILITKYYRGQNQQQIGFQLIIAICIADSLYSGINLVPYIMGLADSSFTVGTGYFCEISSVIAITGQQGCFLNSGLMIYILQRNILQQKSLSKKYSVFQISSCLFIYALVCALIPVLSESIFETGWKLACYINFRTKLGKVFIWLFFQGPYFCLLLYEIIIIVLIYRKNKLSQQTQEMKKQQQIFIIYPAIMLFSWSGLILNNISFDFGFRLPSYVSYLTKLSYLDAVFNTIVFFIISGYRNESMIEADLLDQALPTRNQQNRENQTKQKSSKSDNISDLLRNPSISREGTGEQLLQEQEDD